MKADAWPNTGPDMVYLGVIREGTISVSLDESRVDQEGRAEVAALLRWKPVEVTRRLTTLVLTHWSSDDLYTSLTTIGDVRRRVDAVGPSRRSRENQRARKRGAGEIRRLVWRLVGRLVRVEPTYTSMRFTGRAEFISPRLSHFLLGDPVPDGTPLPPVTIGPPIILDDCGVDGCREVGPHLH